VCVSDSKAHPIKLLDNHSYCSRSSSGLVSYLHKWFVRMTNGYDGASAVFAAICGLALVLFQRFSAFWAISRERLITHFQIPSWITRENDVLCVMNLGSVILDPASGD